MTAKVLSLKILGSGRRLRREMDFPGNRDRIRRFAMMRRKEKEKPKVLVAQEKPADVKREESMRLKKTPPRDPAQLARPVAKPRRALNQWPMVPMATVLKREVPKPPMREKTRMKW